MSHNWPQIVLCQHFFSDFFRGASRDVRSEQSSGVCVVFQALKTIRDRAGNEKACSFIKIIKNDVTMVGVSALVFLGRKLITALT